MRDIPENLAEKLAAGTTTLCRCWIVTRADGVSQGFTDHDADLEINGVLCEAGSGLEAGELEASTGLSVDNLQAVGALSSTGISEVDVVAGRYDDAKVGHWLVDWQEPASRILQFRGTIGEITRQGVSFTAELRGLSEALNAPVGRSYQRTCDLVVGSKKCGFDLNAQGFSITHSVSDVLENRRLILTGADGFEARWFENGHFVWLTGENAGTQGRVKFDEVAGGERHIELWVEAPHEIQKGDQFTVYAGCDKRAQTCRLKFQNFPNFRGFPHIPGQDWVASYPASGDILDGASRYGN